MPATDNASSRSSGQRFDEASLAGFTVGITADRRWEEQAELLQRRGAQVLHGPTIRTLPVGPDEELYDVTELLLMNPPDFVVANTGIGMRAWLAAADSWGFGDALTTMLKDSLVFARGPKASAAMHQSGIGVAARASSERLDELVTLLIEAGVNGRTVAFQRHGDDSPEAVGRLRTAGARIVEIPVYRWILPTDLSPAHNLIDAVLAGSVQALTFTSAPAVRNLFLIACEYGCDAVLLKALNSTVTAMTVGPVCAAAAVDLGIKEPLVPDRFRIGPMIRTLTEALSTSDQRTSIGGVPTTITGTEVRIGMDVVSLSSREAALLGALLKAAPKLVSRTELLAQVWTPDTDPHVIEVTVGRLRRRLGVVGAAIVAVPKRGYLVRP